MSDLAQRSLLLRQLAALRRSGVDHDEALRIAAEGLPPGRVGAAVDEARRALAAGEGASGDDALVRLLATGDASVERLERAAAAVDAEMAADAALATARLYFGIAIAGPLVIFAVLGWVSPVDGIAGEMWTRSTPFSPYGEVDGMPTLWRATAALMALAKWAGIPAALGVVVALRRLPVGWTPGLRELRAAGGLLDAAATGADPGPLVGDFDRAYLEARRGSVGAEAAAAEVAAELVREADGKLAAFRHLAPVVAAIVAVILGWPVFAAVFLWPMLQMSRGLM